MVQQQLTLGTLWRRLRPCGAFVVEDLHTSFAALGSQWRDDDAGRGSSTRTGGSGGGGGGGGGFVPTTLELLLGGAASPLVDFRRIMAFEAERLVVYRPSDEHITAIIFKKCGI